MAAVGWGEAKGLLDMPNRLLEKILVYHSYSEIVALRLTCRTIRRVCDRVLNAAFLDLQKEVDRATQEAKAKVRRAPARVSTAASAERQQQQLMRYTKLLILQSELNLLHAVCARYVARGKATFTGGAILDLFRKTLSSSDGSDECDADIIAPLFFLNEEYLDHFEDVLEPEAAKLLGIAAARFGPKIVDILSCCIYSSYQFVMAYDGLVVHVVGVYETTNSYGVRCPPAADGRRYNEEEGLKALMRYLRNGVRWNNLFNALEKAHDTKTDSEDACGDESDPPLDLSHCGYEDNTSDYAGSRDVLYERLFKRDVYKPRTEEGYKISLDLKCVREVMPASLKPHLDAFDAEHARAASGEQPQQKRAEESDEEAPPPLPPGGYEFTLQLRARHAERAPDQSSELRETQLSLYQCGEDSILSSSVASSLGPLAAEERSPQPRSGPHHYSYPSMYPYTWPYPTPHAPHPPHAARGPGSGPWCPR